MIAVVVMVAMLLVVALVLLATEQILGLSGEATVRVNSDRTIQAESGETLLSVLNSNKLYVPSACGGKATCGLCKVRVESGGARSSVENLFMTPGDRAAGMRLACQVRVSGEVKVRLPETLLGAKMYSSVITAVDTLTYDTKLVQLSLGGETLDFKPGQYVQLLVPGTDQFRAYSVASPPSRARSSASTGAATSPEIELIIRYVPGGLCTGWVHKALEKGDRVKLTGPFGDFFLHEDSQREIVAIGGGSGMAPMRSIILHLAEQGMPRKVTLFFGARSLRDLFFLDDYRDLEKRFANFRYVPALSEPKPNENWTGETGFITQVATKYLNRESEKEAVLCGPPPMIDAAMRVLPKLGIPADRVYFDKF
jgi:Na+-transporting NADH:ubiquinone oxidoreductase subunit F